MKMKQLGMHAAVVVGASAVLVVLGVIPGLCHTTGFTALSDAEMAQVFGAAEPNDRECKNTTLLAVMKAGGCIFDNENLTCIPAPDNPCAVQYIVKTPARCGGSTIPGNYCNIKPTTRSVSIISPKCRVNEGAEGSPAEPCACSVQVAGFEMMTVDDCDITP